MELLPFQVEASAQIAERFRDYMEDPLLIRRTQPVPFYLNLATITGAGKTLILADAVEQIRSQVPLEPIVLWLSKGRVVVWQTFANLSALLLFGILSHLIENRRANELSRPSVAFPFRAESGRNPAATLRRFSG